MQRAKQFEPHRDNAMAAAIAAAFDALLRRWPWQKSSLQWGEITAEDARRSLERRVALMEGRHFGRTPVESELDRTTRSGWILF